MLALFFIIGLIVAVITFYLYLRNIKKTYPNNPVDENDKPINGEYVVAVYLRDPDKKFSTRELFVEVGIDFDYREYHQLEEQEKDQLVIYFIPMEMLL